jgi:hypothetical protein
MNASQANVIKEKSSESKNMDEASSVCETMKSNTSQIIRKMESHIPTFAQLSSDLYSEYLHMYDDLFATCYAAQKDFLDKAGMDQNMLTGWKEYWKLVTQITNSQIDFAANFAKEYVKTRIATIKLFDHYAHQAIDSYAKVFSKGSTS